jgi:hypothetical protein
VRVCSGHGLGHTNCVLGTCIAGYALLYAATQVLYCTKGTGKVTVEHAAQIAIISVAKHCKQAVRAISTQAPPSTQLTPTWRSVCSWLLMRMSLCPVWAAR